MRIAVLDSGIEIDHPELVGLQLADDLHVVDRGIQIEVKQGDGTDIFGHGTAIAGVIGRIAPTQKSAAFAFLVKAWPRAL